jgi:hypothetical protein
MNVVPSATIYAGQNTIAEIRNAGLSATTYGEQNTTAFFILKTEAINPCTSGHKLLVPKGN